jgi:glycosyltransferase involved in cell wall biosynthesis
MDPEPLIEAFSLVAPKYPEWKLRFLGGFHPDTGYRKLYQHVESLARSKISSKQLEFIPWQPEKNLGKYLKDVAFAVHLAKPTLEDYYAHRVRLLTLLKAGIPVITGGKDVVSDLIDEIKAGIKLEGSVEDLVNRLEMVMTDSKILIVWRLQISKVWKLLRKREYIPEKMAENPG